MVFLESKIWWYLMRRIIVILANSIMHGGRCIAGKDLNTKEWVRLKSPFEHAGLNGAFSQQDLLKLCGDKNGPQLLDVWEIAFGEKCPFEHQPENIKVEKVRWKKKIILYNIDDLVEVDDCEWIDSGSPTSKIYRSYFELQKYSSSLAFLLLTYEKNKTTIIYKTKNGQYKPRLAFFFNGQGFDLPITDIKYPKKNNEVPSQELKVAYITLGLGTEYEGAYYKLVVGLVPYNQTNQKVIL